MFYNFSRASLPAPAQPLLALLYTHWHEVSHLRVFIGNAPTVFTPAFRSLIPIPSNKLQVDRSDTHLY